MWTKFDDEQQNDASHFLQELVDLADSKEVILGHHLVDLNQRVHHRQVFPTYLIFPDQSGSEELEQLIAEWLMRRRVRFSMEMVCGWRKLAAIGRSMGVGPNTIGR